MSGRRLRALLGVSLSLVALGWVILRIDLDELAASFGRFQWIWTVPLVLVYLSGFFFGEPNGRFVAAIVPLEEEPAVVTANTELGRVLDFTWFKDVRDYNDSEVPLAGCVRLIKKILGERGIEGGKIGVEKDAIPWFMVEALNEALPKATLVDISDQLERQRLVKSQEEIDLTRQGADLCKIGVRAAEEAIQVRERAFSPDAEGLAGISGGGFGTGD